MEIRPIDPTDDAELRRYHTIHEAAWRHGRPLAPDFSLREFVLMFRQKDPTESIEPFAAYEGDAMVGGAFYALPLLDNTEKAWIEVTIAPDQRRRGIGSALVDYLVGKAKEDGRTTVISESYYPFEARQDHPYRGFAERNGFAVSLTEIRRDLQLPVAETLVQQWIQDAAEHHAGYRIETYDNKIPDEFIESFLYVVNQLAVDAPQGDNTWEPEAMTPEALEQKRLNAIEAGRRVYDTVAISPSNEVVAYTTLAVPAEELPNIYQYGTLVREDHRGHRLGLAVKARSLAEVQHRHPERTRIITTNAEVNQQMVGINELMGFERVEINAEFTRHI